MATVTVADALAEARSLARQVERLRKKFLAGLVMSGVMADPVPEGSATAEQAAWAQVKANQARIQVILSAVAKSDAATPATVGGVTQPILAWLFWRSEIADKHLEFLQGVLDRFAEAKLRYEAGGSVKFAMDEAGVAAEYDALQTTLETLKAKLSVLNATTTVDV